MRKELFAAAMILGIIVLAACTKMNPIEEIIENQNCGYVIERNSKQQKERN